MPPARPCTCLLVLADKKLAQLDELYSCTTEEVLFVPFDPSFGSAGPVDECDCVLHKAGYDAVVCAADPSAAQRWDVLMKLSARSLLIEPVDSAVRFSDRGELCRALEQLFPVVQQPRFTTLPDAQGASDAVAAAGLVYPLLCKPIIACGPHGHSLVLIMRDEGLQELCVRRAAAFPFLAQEYVPHGGFVLKAYRVGDLVHTQLKRSLPIIHDSAGAPALVEFDSQDPLEAMTLTGKAGQGTKPVEAAEGSTDSPFSAQLMHARADEIRPVVDAIAAHMGVELLGIDALLASDGRWLVVDANHNSGAPASVPGFAAALARLVRKHVGAMRAGTVL